MDSPRSNQVQKTNIKYKIDLVDEQKAAKGSIHNFDVTFILGNYGTGKTQVACLAALDILFKRDNPIDKIIISRPINFDATGFIKGSMDDKMQFHILPIKQGMYEAFGKEKIDSLFREGIISVIPIDYMKGINLRNCVAVIDEFEDINFKEFELILSRLCKDSKMIFTGSAEQIGIENSCMDKVKKLKNSGLVGYHTLVINHRNEVIAKILDYINAN